MRAAVAVIWPGRNRCIVLWLPRIKGKGGRGVLSKTIVFGLMKRQAKVYPQIVPDCAKSMPQVIMLRKVQRTLERDLREWVCQI